MSIHEQIVLAAALAVPVAVLIAAPRPRIGRLLARPLVAILDRILDEPDDPTDMAAMKGPPAADAPITESEGQTNG